MEEGTSFLSYIDYGIYSVTSFLVNYGWYLVGLGIFYAVYRDKINKYLDDWYEKREERLYAAKYHKNPDLARERMEAVNAARLKMQEELSRKAALAEEKRKAKEEQKREEVRKLLEGSGQKPGGSSSASTSKSEYLPLMGDNGSTYRPPKRSCCKKGGGCG